MNLNMKKKKAMPCRVGVALLRGEYKEAVQLIMQPRDGERQETAEARRLYLETGAPTAHNPSTFVLAEPNGKDEYPWACVELRSTFQVFVLVFKAGALPDWLSRPGHVACHMEKQKCV